MSFTDIKISAIVDDTIETSSYVWLFHFTVNFNLSLLFFTVKSFILFNIPWFHYSVNDFTNRIQT